MFCLRNNEERISPTTSSFKLRKRQLFNTSTLITLITILYYPITVTELPCTFSKELQIRRTTYKNQGHSHCLALLAPTLDLRLEIMKSRKFVISRILPNYKILISTSNFTASQNGTTKQTDESWCIRRFCIPFSKTGFTG
jgi:hypothetical protein